MWAETPKHSAVGEKNTEKTGRRKEATGAGLGKVIKGINTTVSRLPRKVKTYVQCHASH